MTSKLEQDLINAIENEQNHFNMASWSTDPDACEAHRLITCDTANCMAGHIVALRPKLAIKLAPAHTVAYGSPAGKFHIRYDRLAAAIWKKETGEDCRLDFFAGKANEYEMDLESIEDLTREDAVKHIRGEHPHWPLFSDDDTSAHNYE